MFHYPVLYCLWISIEVQAYSEIMFWYRFTLTEAVICLPHETRTHTDTHTVWVTDYSLTEAYKNTSLSSHPASWHTVSHHKSPCQNHRKASSCLIAWKSVCVFGACWCFNYITADITAVSVQPVLFVWKTVTALKLNAGFGPPVRGSCPPTPWMLILKKTSVRVIVTVCGLIFFMLCGLTDNLFAWGEWLIISGKNEGH